LQPDFIRIVGSSSQEVDLTDCFSFTDDGLLAGRDVTCPKLLAKPDAVIQLPFAGDH
jgi:hypothetical protein